MKITITNKLCLTRCPADLAGEVCSRLTFTNPKWAENEKMGRWQKGTPKLLRCYEIDPTGALIVPRGFGDQLVACCRAFDVRFTFDDQRRVLPEVDTTSTVNQGCQHA